MCIDAESRGSATSGGLCKQKVDGQREKVFDGRKRVLGDCVGVQKFNRYLYGKEFIMETDHCGLQYLKTGSIKNARVMRWYLALQNYTFRVRYIKGSENTLADYLSRGLE